MGLFGKSIIGLEMDSREIRAVEISGSVKQPVISAWGQIDLPEGVVKDGRVVNVQTLSLCLEKLITQGKFKSRDVILGVNNQDVIIRFASFPKVPEDRVRTMITYQAQDFIPVALEELQLDYVILGEKTTEEGEFLNVILVGARKKMLHDYIEAIAGAKLLVQEIDSGMMAFGRAALTTINRKVYALIGLNHDMANIMIINNGSLAMARSVSLALSMSGKKAKAGMDSGAVLADILAGELRSSVGYYRMQHEDDIEGVYLLGKPNLKEIADMFREAEYEASIVQPYAEIPVKGQASSLISFKTTEYATAISLGIRGLEG